MYNIPQQSHSSDGDDVELIVQSPPGGRNGAAAPWEDRV